MVNLKQDSHLSYSEGYTITRRSEGFCPNGCTFIIDPFNHYLDKLVLLMHIVLIAVRE